MDKFVLGILALGLILAAWYGIQFHFDDLMHWLADQNATEAAKSENTYGPFSSVGR